MSATVQSISGGGGSLKPISSFEDEFENGWQFWEAGGLDSTNYAPPNKRHIEGPGSSGKIYEGSTTSGRNLHIEHHYVSGKDYSNVMLFNAVWNPFMLIASGDTRAGNGSVTIELIVNDHTYTDTIDYTGNSSTNYYIWFDPTTKTFKNANTIAYQTTSLSSAGPVNFASKYEIHINGTLTATANNSTFSVTVNSSILRATGGFSL